MVCELKITKGCKKHCVEIYSWSNLRYKVIIEKPTCAGDEMHTRLFFTTVFT